MYRSGYVASVRCKGKNYEGDTIRLPFNAEYELFLKNKTDKDCVCDIYVDGKRIGKHELIIRAHSDYLLERFIGESLTSGQRFKFVPLTGDEVSDKKNPENGIIEARFYPARNYDWRTVKKPDPIVIEKHIYHHEDHYYHPPYYHPRPYQPYPIWYYVGDNLNWNGTIGSGTTTNCTLGLDNIASGCSHTFDSNSLKFTSSLDSKGVGENVETKLAIQQEEAGATVGGSESRQVFGEADIDVDRSIVTVIKLKIVGYSAEEDIEELKGFCGKCGIKISSENDKFCRNCGEKIK
jgi:hypothetical protein